MKFVDAHIHLSDPEYLPILDKIIEDAKRCEVVALVSNSMDLETSMCSLELAKQHAGLVFAALGIHPWNVQKISEKELNSTIEFIKNLNDEFRKSFVAIGEVGLDAMYTMKKELRKFQRKVFHEMLKLAEELSLPVIIHSRGTSVEIAEILTSYNLKKVLFHWFSTPRELLPKLVERGYYITEGPPVLYSRRIGENVKAVPLENLLTETDGPVRYWGPFKGKTTTPAFIPVIVEEIAKLKGLNLAETALQIYNNFIKFFEVEPF